MATISASRHKVFLEALADSISNFENLDPAAYPYKDINLELKEKQHLLQAIFNEYYTKTRQLQKLIEQYEDIQKKARIRLRTCRHIYSKL